MINKEATNCPYCGSTNIKQKDKVNNQLLARGIAFGIKQLTGLRGSTNGILENMDKHYICNHCGKEWIGDGHNPTGMPEDDFQYQKVVSEICNGIYSFSDRDELMSFCWKIDAFVHNITSREKLTGYSFENDFEVSEENKAKFLFLKNFAILSYAINQCSNIQSMSDIEEMDLLMTCEAGMTGCLYLDNHFDSIEENYLCYNILLYICSIYFYNSSESERQSVLNDCEIKENLTNYTFSTSYWQSIIDWMKTLA